jgi:ABC-type uncharacterized transport system involved in gliding motility auxiliary subunit
MKLSPRIHQQQRLKNLFVTAVLLTLLGVAAWLSTRYSVQIDVTGNAGNTLSPVSQKLLAALPGKIQITAYIKKGQPIRAQIAQLIKRYSRQKPDIVLSFIDPDSQPEKSRELAIGAAGLIIIDYQDRTERLSTLDESSLTNALLQLANIQERRITFLTGHGERSPERQANFDLSEFSKALARRKIESHAINLAAMPAIPDNSALLVISAPAVPLMAREIEIIRQYIQRGGNLFLLTDPGHTHMDYLEQSLGLHPLQGAIVDSHAQLYGITDPSFIVASDYSPHPVTQGFQTLTLYPVAAALEMDKNTAYQAVALCSSRRQSWTETGTIKGAISFDANTSEKQGPLTFAFALTRKLAGKPQQRIIAVGDGDFLSNAYVGNVGNLDLGLRMINWLIHDDQFITIPAKTATDKNLQLTQTAVAAIGFGFLLILPLILISTGLLIGYRRKRRY